MRSGPQDHHRTIRPAGMLAEPKRVWGDFCRFIFQQELHDFNVIGFYYRIYWLIVTRQLARPSSHWFSIWLSGKEICHYQLPYIFKLNLLYEFIKLNFNELTLDFLSVHYNISLIHFFSFNLKIE